jgi:deoxyribonuclease-4
MKLGFHVSISGAIDRSIDLALELGCDTFQIFTRNPRSWGFSDLGEEDVNSFKEKWIRSEIDPVFAHMPYIQNLASPNNEIHSRSVDSLIVELDRCSTLGIPFLVTHLGSHLAKGAEQGINNIVTAINTAFTKVNNSVILLLENSSGAGGQLGSSFEEIRAVINRLNNAKRIGVCLDTCHAFSAGYDLRTQNCLVDTLAAFDEVLSFELLKLVHLNDSVGSLGSGIDHHEHIGLGQIGDEGFRLVLHSKLSQVPMIMETPVDDRRSDLDTMMKVRQLAVS